MEAVINDILKERAYQASIWGVEFDNKNTATDWFSYIEEYNHKAVIALDDKVWRNQMIKVASLAVAAVEAFDRNGNLPEKQIY